MLFRYYLDIIFTYMLAAWHNIISCELLGQICVDIIKNYDTFPYNFNIYELLGEHSNKVCLK